MSVEARPNRRAFYGVATWSVPVFALLAAWTLLALMGGSTVAMLTPWVLVLVVAIFLVVRLRWRAVAGLSVGLVVGFATAYLALVVAFSRTRR